MNILKNIAASAYTPQKSNTSPLNRDAVLTRPSEGTPINTEKDTDTALAEKKVAAAEKSDSQHAMSKLTISEAEAHLSANQPRTNDTNLARETTGLSKDKLAIYHAEKILPMMPSKGQVFSIVG